MKKISCSILSSININNGELYERFDFFIRGNELLVVNNNWLEKIDNKEKFNDVLNCIQFGDFKRLEIIKDKIDISNFEIIERIEIKKEAIKVLQNAKEKNNQGQIKKFIYDKFTNTPIIPGSTLKGIFRTVFLYDKLYNDYSNIENKEYINSLNKQLDNELFNFIGFNDVKIKNYEKYIQKILGVNKKANTGKEHGIWQILESINSGEFDIEIDIYPNEKNISLGDDFIQKIKDYSNILITREEQILDNIGIRIDFIDKLNDLYDQGKYPIKIGMFKKSLSYKIFWEEILEDHIYKFNHRKGLKIMDHKSSRTFGVGDKSIYLDENGNPVGWLLLEFK
ncbi:RAMP superfamily CRISPR-associated protein [Candidatus Vampirococcus lugosii]|uniref:CRISPR type III-associated protein domain-containing protein n=1 Tax=Candidatus Vampirococcus lugosii TaxID=2789015 RepID=A0ABS5QL42_9BACT|nr:RAMP superfamily CRISPR-associated protein [Candidatus Vampirococcus lugosii]MBS8121719.1 hypothetical protein [Candidatus Vampirococcus lugosii]